MVRRWNSACMIALFLVVLFSGSAFGQPTVDCEDDAYTAQQKNEPRYLKFAEGRGMIPDPEIGYGPYLNLPKDFVVGTPKSQDGSACGPFGPCDKDEKVNAPEAVEIDDNAAVTENAASDMNEGEVPYAKNPNYETWKKQGFDPDVLSGRDPDLEKGLGGEDVAGAPAESKKQLLQTQTGKSVYLEPAPPGMEWVLYPEEYDPMNPPEYVLRKKTNKDSGDDNSDSDKATTQTSQNSVRVGSPPPMEGTGPDGLVLAPRTPGSDVAKKIGAQKQREYDDAVASAIAIAKEMMPKEEFGNVQQPEPVDIPMLPDIPYADEPPQPGVGEGEPYVQRIYLSPSPSLSPSPTPSVTPTSPLSPPEIEWADCDDAPELPKRNAGEMAVGQYDIDMLRGQKQPVGSAYTMGVPELRATQTAAAFQVMPFRNQEERISRANFRTTIPDVKDTTMSEAVFDKGEGQVFSLQHEPLYHPRPEVRSRTTILAADDMGPYDANLTALDEINNKASYMAHDIINTQSPLRRFILKEELKSNELSHNVTWALMNDPKARPIIEPPAESPAPSPSPSLTPSASPTVSPSFSASPSMSPSLTPSRSPRNSTNFTRSASPSPSPSSSPVPSALVEPEWTDYSNRYQMPDEVEENDEATKQEAIEYQLKYLKQEKGVSEGEVYIKKHKGSVGDLSKVPKKFYDKDALGDINVIGQDVLGEVIPLVQNAANQQPMNIGPMDARKRANTALTPEQMADAMYGASLPSEAKEYDESLRNAAAAGATRKFVGDVNRGQVFIPTEELAGVYKRKASMEMLQNTLRMQLDDDQVGKLEGENPGDMVQSLLRLQQQMSGNLSNATADSQVGTEFLDPHGIDLVDMRGFEENPNSIPPKNPLPLPWKVPREYENKFMHPAVPVERIMGFQGTNVSKDLGAMPLTSEDVGVTDLLAGTTPMSLEHRDSVRKMFEDPTQKATVMPDLTGPTTVADAGGKAAETKETCSFQFSCKECTADPTCGWCDYGDRGSCQTASMSSCTVGLSTTCDGVMNSGRPSGIIPMSISNTDIKRLPFWSKDEVDEAIAMDGETPTPLRALGVLNLQQKPVNAMDGNGGDE